MKNKRPLIYLAAVIVAALVVLAVERPETPRVNDVGEGTFSPGFDSEKVMRVEVSQLMDGAVLERQGKRWRVSEMTAPLRKQLLEKEGREPPPARWYRADSSRIASALGSFGGLGEGLAVSSNPQKSSLYQVDATGLSVRLIGADDKPIVDVVIGKNGPDLASSYIKRASGDTVYLVRRPMTGAFSPSAQDWRDRKIWVFEPKDLAAVKVESANGAWGMTRDASGSWQLTDTSGGTIDGAKAQKDAAILCAVRASGFQEDSEDLKLAKPQITISITDINGKSISLEIFPAASDGSYPARIPGDDEIYLLSKEFVESIPLAAPVGG